MLFRNSQKETRLGRLEDRKVLQETSIQTACTGSDVAGEYRLMAMPFDRISESLLAEWTAFLEHCPSPSPLHYPEWLSESFRGQTSDLTMYFLYRAGSLVGVAPVLPKKRSIKWQVGEIVLARFPLRNLCLLGGGPHFPEDGDAYRLFFRELPSDGFDAVHLEDAPVNSCFWKFLEESPEIGNRFSRYLPESPAPRILLRLQGNFEDYMGQFSPKHRQTLRRKLRKFRDAASGQGWLYGSRFPKKSIRSLVKP